jgi:hypothetical protein
VHKIVMALANHYGIALSERACGGDDLNQPVWNGHNLATLHCLAEYDDDEQIINREYRDLSDHDLLHEIGHWIIAAPEQRDLPEYGLGALAFTTYHFYHSCPEVVDHREAQVQEMMTQLFSVWMGERHGVSVFMSDYVQWSQSLTWESYLEYKIKEHIELDRAEMFWEALIRFKSLQSQLSPVDNLG